MHRYFKTAQMVTPMLRTATQSVATPTHRFRRVIRSDSCPASSAASIPAASFCNTCSCLACNCNISGSAGSAFGVKSIGGGGSNGMSEVGKRSPRLYSSSCTEAVRMASTAASAVAKCAVASRLFRVLSYMPSKSFAVTEPETAACRPAASAHALGLSAASMDSRSVRIAPPKSYPASISRCDFSMAAIASLPVCIWPSAACTAASVEPSACAPSGTFPPAKRANCSWTSFSRSLSDFMGLLLIRQSSLQYCHSKGKGGAA